MSRGARSAPFTWTLLGLVLAAGAQLWRSANNSAKNSPMALLSFGSDGDVVVDRHALAALRAAPSPVCAISIAGPARDGKSTLANAIISSLGGKSDARFDPSHGAGAGADADATDGARVAGGGAAAWLWISPALPRPSAGGCASVAVIDTRGIGGGDGGLGGHGVVGGKGHGRRALAFLMLTSSRLVLNVRRQPSESLLARLEAAAALASPLLPPPGATGAPAGRAALPSPPPAASDHRDRPDLAASLGADLGPISASELVILLRDAHLQLRTRGADLTVAQALRTWAGVPADDPAPRVTDGAFRTQSILQLAAPTERDVEVLGSADSGELPAPSAGQAPATSFGAALGRLASNLTTGVAPIAEVGGGGLATWMELVATWLNEQPA